MLHLHDKEGGPQGGILTLGTFDGLHRGHQQLLQTCRSWARETNTHVEVWLYHPHPRSVLRKEKVPLLTTLTERMLLLSEAEVEVVREIPFSPELSMLRAEDFVREWIVGIARPYGVVLGYDHRFGRERAGSADLLRSMSMPVREVPPYLIEEKPVSSSRIRELIRGGQVSQAKLLLGRPYALWGVVRRGRGIAHQLGVPTANLPWPTEKLRPPAGIYVGRASMGQVRFSDLEQGMPALLYLPPKGDLEVHLLTEQGTFYEQVMLVGFIDFLRPHKEFAREEELRQQIQADLAAARRYFGLQ